MLNYARFSPANSKWTKHTVAEHVSLGGNGPLIVGTPSQVADTLEYWVKEADIDGFNFVSSPPLPPLIHCSVMVSAYSSCRDTSSSRSRSRISRSCWCRN